MAFYTGGTTTLSANGTTDGRATLTDPSFVVKGATVYLSATGLPSVECDVVNVAGSITILRFAAATPALSGSNISAYTTALSAHIDMPAQDVQGVVKQLVISGLGVPAVVADVGTLYLRQDGGASTTLYVKESGSGLSTGWVAK